MKNILSLLALTALTIGLLDSCKKEDPKVSVTGISLDKTELTITVGDPDVQLTATVAPENATEKSVNWSINAESVATVDASGKVTTVAPGDATITVTTVDGGMTATCAVKVKAALPANALPGEFSVSTTKKVHFSQGNLVASIDASGTPTAWKFAANQYDYIGEGGANKTIGATAGDIDFFGWSTASTTYGISTSTSSGSYSGDFVDWGKAYCEKNNITPGNTWRTLSNDEWMYLIMTSGRMVNGKPCYSNDVSGVSIGGTTYKGLFIYPDNYNGDEVSSSMTWDQINAAGIVFLPAAGLRDGSFVGGAGGFGYYWSSAADGSRNAYYVNFNSGGVYPDYRGSRSYGYSVRLITESK